MTSIYCHYNEEITVQIDFKPLADSKIGELTANFNIVIGTTPNEQDAEPIEGGVGKPESHGGRRPPPRHDNGRGAGVN